jgi:DNA polymerase-3 subunit delta'
MLSIAPEEGKYDIAVGQLRELLDKCTLTRQLGRYRTAIVAPAERMTRSAANTFLKTLEEPPAGTVFLLVSDNPAIVLPTIRSRCQLYRFVIPHRKVASAWLSATAKDSSQVDVLLEAARGAPLVAAQMAQGEVLAVREQVDAGLRNLLRRADPVVIARDWNKLALPDVLHWMHARVEDLLKRASTGEIRLDVARLYCILDEVVAAKKLIASRGNPNAQLLLEHLALTWSDEGLGTAPQTTRAKLGTSSVGQGLTTL